MEMIAIEGVCFSQDLTPPLTPLAFALHDHKLKSHCSACFSPIQDKPFHPFIIPQNPQNVQNSKSMSIYYCSSRCSSLDSPLHFSSGEPQLLSQFDQSDSSTWSDSSELRLSLRLIHTLQKLKLVSESDGFYSGESRLIIGRINGDPFQENENIEGPDENLEDKDEELEINCNPNDAVLERIGGLMTNRERLMFPELNNNPSQECDGDGDSADNFRKYYKDSGVNSPCISEEEFFLERIRDGANAISVARRICSVHECLLEESVLCLVLTNAVEVQDRSGQSIGIAVYDNTFSWINHSCSPNACYRFLTGSEDSEPTCLRIGSAAVENGDDGIFKGREGYGPRVKVRSIKAIDKGEEVTIAYTDLLQPKEMRKRELWLKYRFNCNCKRCSAVPTTYVDSALEAVSASNFDCGDIISDHKEKEIDKLREAFDDAITDYLSFNDPKLCCLKLESLFTHGSFDENRELKETKLHQNLKLHPFHHLSLNAYTVMASAYKVRANDLLALDKLEAFSMFKTSAAYSLFLAVVSEHLFMFESSLVASVANFWISAGESLFNLSRNFFSENPSLIRHKCHECSLGEILEFDSITDNVQFRQRRTGLLNCIARLVSKLWGALTSGSCFLKLIPNPINFEWVESAKSYKISDFKFDLKSYCSVFEDKECADQIGIDYILLGVHCLRYGALLSSICHGVAVSVDMYDKRLVIC